jgi:acetylornithine deacetylase
MSNAFSGQHMDLDLLDQRVEAATEALVTLTSDLVAFDTTSVDLRPDSEHRENEEAALQGYVRARLEALGAEVDQWEPDPTDFAEHPMMPPGHHWRGRPLTVGVLRGRGGGRSMLIDAHVDVVGPGDPGAWTSPPFRPELRDGRLYGRGTVDMKGGLAAALIALETLRDAGIALAGDVIVQAVPDEESCGMGTVAAIHRGYRADAGLAPEPTALDLWAATRGILHGTLQIDGRSGHAELTQPPADDGGAVNAIEKAAAILAALRELAERWQEMERERHPLLGTPTIVPTLLRAGDDVANVPSSARLTINTSYLASMAAADGFGSRRRAEIEAAVAAAAGADEWLSEHPPRWTWHCDYPPAEMTGHPINDVVQGACRALGLPCAVVGIDTTFDGALLTCLGATTCPAFGAGDLRRAHKPDEWIGVDELVRGAQLYARVLVDWCGTAR